MADYGRARIYLVGPHKTITYCARFFDKPLKEFSSDLLSRRGQFARQFAIPAEFKIAAFP
jgi:hypothetical protein